METVVLSIALALISILGLGYSLILILIFGYGSKTPKIGKDETFTPTVSVVIPTRNEEQIIRSRLENVLASSYPREKLEVIFVDGSSDNTPNIIHEYAERYPFIRMEKQRKPGFNNALNQGFASASGEIVIKSDCDAFFQPDTIRSQIASFADSRVGMVSGIYANPLDSRSSIEAGFRKIEYRIQVAESYFHSSLVARCAACRRELIPQLPEYVTSDDALVAAHVIRHGYRAILDPTVVSSEYCPDDFRLRRQIRDRRAAGFIQVIMQNVGMMFNPKYGWAGMLTYPLDFFITILSPILIAAIAILSLVYGALYQPLVAVVLAALIGTAFLLLLVPVKNRWLSMIRAGIDINLSCFLGLFKAFKKEKTWQRSEEVRLEYPDSTRE